MSHQYHRLPLRFSTVWARAMKGEMITTTVDGSSRSLWKQGDEFIMVKQYAGSNSRHSLCADETSPERLAAHWLYFSTTL